MPDPKMLRALARRCRGLLASRTKPEVGRQLSIWFREILDQAKQAGGDARIEGSSPERTPDYHGRNGAAKVIEATHLPSYKTFRIFTQGGSQLPTQLTISPIDQENTS